MNVFIVRRPMNYQKISILLCTYGFFKAYRPSEPFISPYLTEFKNFTIEQVNQEIYPIGTYFYSGQLIAIFLLTDFLRYKPVLFVGGLCAVITWCLLIFGTTIWEMQIVEFFYSIFSASEVAYYTYIYAKVERTHYERVTSYTRGALLLGKASAGLSSQLFVYFNVFDYLQLNYLTVAGVGIATLSCIWLPSVSKSIYFHNRVDEENANIPYIKSEFKNIAKIHDNKSSCSRQICNEAFSNLFKDFKEAFTSCYVIQWSAWWALATCGYLQVISYSQLLWEDIIYEEDTLYNGYVEFVSSILGAAASFGTGYFKVPWDLWGEVSLGVLTIAQGFLMWYCSYVTNLLVAYAVHVTYQVFYQAAITVANYEVAKRINPRSQALVFGINTFLALVIQTILTGIVINALKMNIRDQFKLYGGYHFCIGIGFLISGIITLTYLRKKNLVTAL